MNTPDPLQNLGWAFGHNVAPIPLAALGLLNPIFAGAAMGSSSVSVVANSLRLLRFRDPGPRSHRAPASAPVAAEPGGADYVPVHLRDGGWVEGYRRASTVTDDRVLLLDPVAVGDRPGAVARPPDPSEAFLPSCDTERIEPLAAPSTRRSLTCRSFPRRSPTSRSGAAGVAATPTVSTGS